jgi:hypothetical protein
MRVVEGAHVVRRYQPGRDGDPEGVAWQATFSQTGRECTPDLQAGTLTIDVGISGRLVAGSGSAVGSTVSLPVKVAVVHGRDAVVAAEARTITVNIPPQGSTVFSDRRSIVIPFPGFDRTYAVLVGFNAIDWDPLNPTASIAAATAPPPPPPPAAPPPPPPPQQPPPQESEPRQLPTPGGGFVLPGG